jgi:hypothetical protein
MRRDDDWRRVIGRRWIAGSGDSAGRNADRDACRYRGSRVVGTAAVKRRQTSLCFKKLFDSPSSAVIAV